MGSNEQSKLLQMLKVCLGNGHKAKYLCDYRPDWMKNEKTQKNL